MPIDVDRHKVFETARADRELAYELRGFTGRVRLGIVGQRLDLLFENRTATFQINCDGVETYPLAGAVSRRVRVPVTLTPGTLSTAGTSE